MLNAYRRIRCNKKKATLFRVTFFRTKRTGLEPATSAVTGLRSNQTELPLRVLRTGGLYTPWPQIASIFFRNCKKNAFPGKIQLHY